MLDMALVGPEETQAQVEVGTFKIVEGLAVATGGAFEVQEDVAVEVLAALEGERSGFNKRMLVRIVRRKRKH
jgi:hypothetical protein